MNREQAIQEVKERYREILQPAKVKGTYICPLCNNGTGSTGDGMSIDPHGDGLHFKCFKCGFYGDVIDLYQKEKSYTFNEAANALCNELGIVIDDNSRQPAEAHTEAHTERQKRTDSTEEPPADYMKYYSECVTRLDDPAAIEYLNRRGISRQTAELYFIGYDPQWQSPKAIKDGKNPPKSPRLIIPTGNSSYLARDTRSDLTESEKKFAKMKEGGVHLFHTEALYYKHSPVFITEGEIDAMSIAEVGGHAVGLGSANNCNKLVEVLKDKPTKNPLIICLDDDDAGKKATQSLTDRLSGLSIPYIIANICGQYKDPNEALTADRAGFIEAIRKAERKATKPYNAADYLAGKFAADIADFKKSNNRKTGFEHLDHKIGGLYAGLYVVGAMSSLGKTTFIHQMADQLAEAGEHVLFFSLEQSRFEMVSKSLNRIISKHNPRSTITSLDIRKGRAEADELERAIKEYALKVGDRMSIIEGDFTCNLSFIRDYVEEYIEKNGVRPVVIVDYLQVLNGTNDQRQTTKDVVDMNIKGLKDLSRNNKIPVILISSLNRANYTTPVDYESFKESGSIEYTADVVWGLQLDIINDTRFNEDKKIKEKREIIRDEMNSNPRKINLIGLKNRYGRKNFVANFVYYPANDLIKEASITGYSFILEDKTEREEQQRAPKVQGKRRM